MLYVINIYSGSLYCIVVMKVIISNFNPEKVLNNLMLKVQFYFCIDDSCNYHTFML